MNHVTVRVDLEKYQEITDFYLPYQIGESKDYLDHRSNYNGVIVTGYLSNSSKRTVSFKGETAEEEARRFNLEIKERKVKERIPTKWIEFHSQIGSDEVGVGDFLLPMIVVAAYVRSSQIKILRELGIDDSKKMTDAKILEVGPIVTKEFEFSKLTLRNDKYNEMYVRSLHLNSMKAKMHNRALANLKRSKPNCNYIFVDQFASEERYYEYLGEKDEPIIRNITFKEKGESYYPSVALASVIARYSFLLEKKALEEKLGMEIPFGASSRVDEVAKKILQQVGREEFDKLVKKNFKNYNRVIEG